MQATKMRTHHRVSALKSGDISTTDMPVVVNVQTLAIGVDWDLRRLVLACPTKSETLYMQIVGRALRRAGIMVAAIILDSTQRLGFVTDITHNQLDVGKPRKHVKAEHKATLAIQREGCG